MSKGGRSAGLRVAPRCRYLGMRKDKSSLLKCFPNVGFFYICLVYPRFSKAMLSPLSSSAWSNRESQLRILHVSDSLLHRDKPALWNVGNHQLVISLQQKLSSHFAAKLDWPLCSAITRFSNRVLLSITHLHNQFCIRYIYNPFCVLKIYN